MEKIRSNMHKQWQLIYFVLFKKQLSFFQSDMEFP